MEPLILEYAICHNNYVAMAIQFTAGVYTASDALAILKVKPVVDILEQNARILP
ncbi:hypothetical protein [Clostridium sp. AF27-2AA]|uniref:hypothetical protein n=1 Tax=Clostridium sp. AF27-2AA TaxID=2292206 RepID=UPI001FAACD3C|nr:hypothetical protein [Clostridium sp. AF27-2AA]